MSFSKKCRYCSVKIDNGTGVIVSPNTEEYSYILTAKHNLYSNYENKKCKEPKSLDSIKLVAYDESIKLSLLDKYELDECDIDIAILKIKKVDTCAFKIKLEPEMSQICFLYGYPENRRKDKYTKEEQTPNLKLEVLDIHKNDNHVIVKNDEYRVKKDINGYSGGGVFTNINDEPHLVGIEFRMDFNDEVKEGNNTRLRMFSIKAFNKIVEKYKDELLYLEEVELAKIDIPTSKQEEIKKSYNNIKGLSASGDINIHIGDKTLKKEQMGFSIKIIILFGIFLLMVIVITIIWGIEPFVSQKKLECPKAELISLEKTKSKNIFKNTNIYLYDIAVKSCTFRIDTQLKEIEFDELEKITIDTCQYNINIPKHNKKNCTIKFQLKGD